MCFEDQERFPPGQHPPPPFIEAGFVGTDPEPGKNWFVVLRVNHAGLDTGFQLPVLFVFGGAGGIQG